LPGISGACQVPSPRMPRQRGQSSAAATVVSSRQPMIDKSGRIGVSGKYRNLSISMEEQTTFVLYYAADRRGRRGGK
jgi:hypothetical protein